MPPLPPDPKPGTRFPALQSYVTVTVTYRHPGELWASVFHSCSMHADAFALAFEPESHASSAVPQRLPLPSVLCRWHK